MKHLDLTKLKFDTKNAIGSGNGSYYQALDQSVTPTRYYKLSNFDQFGLKSIGYESYFEVITYKLGKMLGIDVLEYHLVEASITLQVRNRSKKQVVNVIMCYSEDFRNGGETKMSLDSWYRLNFTSQDIETTLRNYSQYINDYLDKMFIFDFIICNRDRHRGNIEVLIDKNNNLRLSPLFDNGQSFCAPSGVNEIDIRNFDFTKDICYNDGIGVGYHFHNVERISKPVFVNPLPGNFRKILFYGMNDYLPTYVMNSVANTIEYRYRVLKQQGFIVER